MLERAIFEAVLEQLRTVGYGAVTMEGIATAARTGKAALYRRWSSIDELIVDALRHTLPSPRDLPIHDSVRDDLLELLRCQAAGIRIAHNAAYQIVKERRDATSDLLHRAVRERFSDPVQQCILEALQRGVERGEVRPEAATAQVARVGPAMIIHRRLSDGPDIPDDYVVSLVDEVILPLCATHR